MDSIFKGQALPLSMGPIGGSETLITNYHSALLKIQEERRSRSYRGGSLKFLIFCYLCNISLVSLPAIYRFIFLFCPKNVRFHVECITVGLDKTCLR
jgi:hypothetical protein